MWDQLRGSWEAPCPELSFGGFLWLLCWEDWGRGWRSLPSVLLEENQQACDCTQG